jgi:site-specific recombinase XerD
VYRGLCNARLVNAVPAIPSWTLASLPKSFNEQQLASLLQSFDLSTSIGRRDYAIALCLIGLGLRSNEVAALSLDEIDWRKGVLRIHHGKGQRINLLPLSADTGRAIALYIRHDRPPTQQRNVFVRHVAPIGEPIKSCAIQAIIRRAFKHSGITTPFMGSHMLRHTAATRMVQAGVSIKEVADILGHRSINTTCIYAKVDLPTLSSVAMPWPEVQ